MSPLSKSGSRRITTTLSSSESQRKRNANDQPMARNPAQPNYTSNDILLGRGHLSVTHAGNVRLRNLIKIGTPTCSRVDLANFKGLDIVAKRATAQNILRVLKAETPPSRFLERDQSTGVYHEVDDKRAITKISQTIRDLSTKPLAVKSTHPLDGFICSLSDEETWLLE